MSDPISEEEIQAAAEVLRSGGMVAFPTETVYGVGANALDATAVQGLFELKGRPSHDPLIVHVADAEDLCEVARSIPSNARILLDRFWPGPLTIVLPKLPVVPDIVTAGLATVAVRCPNHDVARRLIRACGFPLAAPSANRFGKVSPSTAPHVAESFGEHAPMILDAGPCSVGVESTVLSLADGPPRLLRPGGVTLEQIEAVIGTVVVGPAPATGGELSPESPGMLPEHYAPATRLRLQKEPIAIETGERVGLLCLTKPADTSRFADVEVLSQAGDLDEAAANLYAALRRLDARQLDRIVAIPLPSHGLGRAIMDRLRRAAASS